MKNKRSYDLLKILATTVAAVWLTGMLSFLPWWSFAVSVLAVGVLTTKAGWRYSGFGAGFLAGFIVWAGGNVYFQLILHGHTLNRIAGLVPVPGFLVPIAGGIAGGLIGGLALHAGRQLFVPSGSPEGL